MQFVIAPHKMPLAGSSTCLTDTGERVADELPLPIRAFLLPSIHRFVNGLIILLTLARSAA